MSKPKVGAGYDECCQQPGVREASYKHTDHNKQNYPTTKLNLARAFTLDWP